MNGEDTNLFKKPRWTAVQGQELGIAESIRLANHASILQAEVLVRCNARWILEGSATMKYRAKFTQIARQQLQHQLTLSQG